MRPIESELGVCFDHKLVASKRRRRTVKHHKKRKGNANIAQYRAESEARRARNKIDTETLVVSVLDDEASLAAMAIKAAKRARALRKKR